MVSNGFSRIFLLIGLAAASLAVPGTKARAQDKIDYPVDTVTLVTDSNPGGGTDVYFREMIKYLGPMMDVNFVVKNNSAGGGASALAEAATGPADGSVLYGVTPSYIFMSLLTDLEKDRNDVEPLVQIFDDPVVLYVNTKSPFQTLGDVIADAKANPGKQKWAAGSPTSISRIALESMKTLTGVDVTVVPHDSGSDTILNILNGSLDLGIGEAGETAEQVAAGNLRRVALLRDAPTEDLPGLATAKSQGVELSVSQFRGLVGPKGLPADVVDAWDKAIPALLENPDFKAWYQKVGMLPTFKPQSEFVPFVDEFAQQQETVLRELGALK
jgi:putative tricarboxylic transport membrane protein